MNCPKCKNDNNVKDGIAKGKQRYKCKFCNYRYSVEIKSTAKPKITKRQALELYLEGLGFRSIGRFLGVSHVSVYQWIKVFGENVEEIRSDDIIEIIEMDKMRTYIGDKKTTVACLPDRQAFGLLLIEMEKDLSTAYLAIEEQKQAKIYGS